MKSKQIKKSPKSNLTKDDLKGATFNRQALKDSFLKYVEESSNKELDVVTSLKTVHQTYDEIFKPMIEIYNKTILKNKEVTKEDFGDSIYSYESLVETYNSEIDKTIEENKDNPDFVPKEKIEAKNYTASLKTIVEDKQAVDKEYYDKITTAKEDIYKSVKETYTKSHEMIVNGYLKESQREDLSKEERDKFILMRETYMDICEYKQLKEFAKTNEIKRIKRVMKRLDRYINDFDWAVSKYTNGKSVFKRIIGTMVHIASNANYSKPDLSKTDMEKDKLLTVELVMFSLLNILLYGEYVNYSGEKIDEKIKFFTIYQIYYRLIYLCCNYEPGEEYIGNLDKFLDYVESLRDAYFSIK